MPKAKTYYCFKQCVYGPKGQRRLYKEGEKLRPGLSPGKYFSEDGSPPDDMIVLNVAKTAGDDSRPTAVIRKELKEHFNVKMPAKATRKELFSRYKEEESKVSTELIEAAKEKAEAEIEKSPKEIEAEAILEKKFQDMTPDEIEKIDSGDIAKKIQSEFGKAVRPTAKNKMELLTKGIQFETHGDS